MLATISNIKLPVIIEIKIQTSMPPVNVKYKLAINRMADGREKVIKVKAFSRNNTEFKKKALTE